MFPFDTLSVEIFGASHAEEIGVRINNVPRDAAIDAARLQAFLDERKAGISPWSTPRNEPDRIIVKSGLTNGKTDGNELVAVIENVCKKSSDYDSLRFTPRPSHADYVARIKDGENADLAGGGRFSGRMTAPLCIAGGIALQILSHYGIELGAYVSEIGNVQGKSYLDGVTLDEINRAKEKGDFALSNTDKMTDLVLSARQKGDSVGGAVECVAFGVPAGLGDALFCGTEGKIAASVFAVPAVKSVEFGLGKGFASSFGSQANDPFCVKDGKIATETNNNGGINGGITNGMPITVRTTFKPTPSISLPQKTVDLRTNTETTITIKGRHDACVVPRAVPAVKAAVALALLDSLLNENKLQ